MLYALANHAPKSVRPLDWILTILGLGGSTFQAMHPGLWFFTVLVEAYLLLPILIRITKGNENQILMFSILLSLINRGFLGFLDHESNLFYFLLHVNYIGSYIFQFSLGIFLGSHYLKRQYFARELYLIFLLIFVLGASIYVGLSFQGYDLAYRWGFDITTLGFIFLVVQWCCHQLAKLYESHASHLKLIYVFTDFLAISGKNSYQIYLIHQPLLVIMLPVLYQGLTRLGMSNSLVTLANLAVISIGLLILEVWVFGICDRQLAKVIRRKLRPA